MRCIRECTLYYATGTLEEKEAAERMASTAVNSSRAGSRRKVMARGHGVPDAAEKLLLISLPISI